MSKKTVKLRHGIVKLIAPKLYQDWLTLNHAVQDTPRPMISLIKEQKQTMLVGCEIGVYMGDNALSILHELNMKRLYLIDPYEPYFENGKMSEGARLEALANAERQAKKNLSKCDSVTFIKKPSDLALQNIQESLDFVYIDGNHTYQYVLNDITNYYPHVKQNGWIGGHDYTLFYPELILAVNDFVKEHSLSRQFQTRYPDWIIHKPNC